MGWSLIYGYGYNNHSLLLLCVCVFFLGREFPEKRNEHLEIKTLYNKTCVKRPLKNRQNKYLNDKR